MLHLIGEYTCKLDDKGRLALPAGLKRQIPTDNNERFVINRGFESCLILYPVKEWEEVVSKIATLNQYKAEVRQFVRHFHRGATELQLDGASRLNLPNHLLGYAGIDRDVVLFAHTNKIEIWNKQAYESMLGNDPESFAHLAEQVMGQMNTNGNGNND